MNTNAQPRTPETVREQVIANTPPLYRTVYLKAYGGNSKATALKAMCLQCSGNVRAEITNCQTFACPLYDYRPYQAGADDTDAPEQATGEQDAAA
jgi:hypothetical protein